MANAAAQKAQNKNQENFVVLIKFDFLCNIKI